MHLMKQHDGWCFKIANFKKNYISLAKPMLVVIGIQSFIIAYNEYTRFSAVMTVDIEAMLN